MSDTRLVHSGNLDWKPNPKYIGVSFKRLITSDKLSCSIVRVEPGGDQGHHIHEGNQEEVTYIIEGNGQALIENQKQSCQAGDCLYFGQGVRHGISNPTDKPLFMLCTFHPPLS